MCVYFWRRVTSHMTLTNRRQKSVIKLGSLKILGKHWHDNCEYLTESFKRWHNFKYHGCIYRKNSFLKKLEKVLSILFWKWLKNVDIVGRLGFCIALNRLCALCLWSFKLLDFQQMLGLCKKLNWMADSHCLGFGLQQYAMIWTATRKLTWTNIGSLWQKDFQLEVSLLYLYI